MKWGNKTVSNWINSLCKYSNLKKENRVVKILLNEIFSGYKTWCCPKSSINSERRNKIGGKEFIAFKIGFVP